MASSNTPANDKGGEQVPTEFLPVNTMSKSTPPSPESANKRKREPVAANINITEETKSSKETMVADIKEIGSKDDSAVETTNHVKEVEMKDAESIDNSVDQSQSVKEIEMQDADQVAFNKPDLDEKDNNKTRSNLNANEGSKEDEELKKDVISENSKKEINDDDGSGQRVLGEVATLLKQVQESDSKAKLEVEVKVKKMEDVDVKENTETNKVDPNRGSG